MEESDPAMKVLCIKRGGNGDRRGRQKLRRTSHWLSAEFGELIS
jgi:hypothetical protein